MKPLTTLMKKKSVDEEDGPVRINTPVDASACPTVGANCRRYVMADAMGMSKEGDRSETDVDGTEDEIGDIHNVTLRCTKVRGSP